MNRRQNSFEKDLPLAVDVSGKINIFVAFDMNPLAIVKVVDVTGQRPPLPPGCAVVTTEPPPPPDETQFGNCVHAPLIQVIFKGPPTLVNPALHAIGTKAPDNTFVVLTPSVGKLKVPPLVILVIVDVDCKKAVNVLIGQRPVAI